VGVESARTLSQTISMSLGGKIIRRSSAIATVRRNPSYSMGLSGGNCGAPNFLPAPRKFFDLITYSPSVEAQEGSEMIEQVELAGAPNS
jgi:hypothetical protein